MEMMVYAKEEMILNRQKLMDQITSHLNIFSSKPSFVALSMVVQLRQQLGYGVVKLIFMQTKPLWFEKLPLSHWNVLILFIIVVRLFCDLDGNNTFSAKTKYGGIKPDLKRYRSPFNIIF